MSERKKSVNYSTHQAKTHLSNLVQEAMSGVDVIICRGKQPVAKLVALTDKEGAAPSRPTVGTITSAPVLITNGAFEALSPEEMAEWGL